MKTYRVQWVIDIEADNPREAAQEAHDIMLDPESEALYFQVYSGTLDTIVDIDLLDE